MLATVVRTWGSSPRPVGSIMALCEDGSVVGSVSGGCIEDDLIYRYAQGKTMPLGAPTIVKYGVSADEAHRFGLPCGGTLELLLEWDPCPDSLEKILASVDAGSLVLRSVQLSDGEVTLSETVVPVELTLTHTALQHCFGPQFRMLLIGAGQLAEYLATMATFNGFAVTICDPRKEYRTEWNVPGVKVVQDMPDDEVRSFKPDQRSCVVALSHDPKLDDLALLEALESDAFYIGAIGSRRNSLARRERMIEHFGHTHESLARLRAPIGMYIASKTPPEIAVSVMAEILAVKNGVRLPESADVGWAKENLIST